MAREYFTEEPTARLQWVPRSMMQAFDRKLQQWWKISKFEDGVKISVLGEWRDVPFEPNPVGHADVAETMVSQT